MIYLELFLTFLQIGAVSFGGGYGMISLIRERKLKERVPPIWDGLWKGARDGTENEHLRLQHALHLIECGGERQQHREGCDEGSSFPRGRFGECVWWR